MARIIVDPTVPAALNAKCRKMRRLVYLAWIARDLGHDVAVRYDAGEIAQLRPQIAYNNTSRFDYLDILGTMPRVTDLDCDLLICSEETAIGQPRPSCKVLAWRTFLGGGFKSIAWQDRFDLLAGYILSQRDFTEKKHLSGQSRDDTPDGSPLGDKWFSVPWLPFEAVQHELYRVGLWTHYLRDNLEPIRERYAASSKKRFAGIRGYCWPWRSRISAAFKGDDRFIFDWADSQAVSMPAADYLRWLSGCHAVMALPGDTWKTSRFAEAVMLGVPVVITRQMFPEIIPTPTSENCLLVDSWTPEELLVAYEAGDIAVVHAQDRAYREGWSLRGQFNQAIAKLGL